MLGHQCVTDEAAARDYRRSTERECVVRVLSWNVQGAFPPAGSTERIADQIEYLDVEADRPDVLLLNEVNANQREQWHDSLQELGYDEIVDTLDWAVELAESGVPPHQDLGHSNGNLTAVHEDGAPSNLVRRRPSITQGEWENSDRKFWSTNFPEKILQARVEIGDEDVDLWNVRAVPGSMYGEEKIEILEDVYARASRSQCEHCLLAGDFNAPKHERADGTVVPWGGDRDESIRDRWTDAEVRMVTGWDGVVDVFRNVHGYGNPDVAETSFESKRFDHLLASESLNPRDCWYDHDGYECSDHAPIVAEFAH